MSLFHRSGRLRHDDRFDDLFDHLLLAGLGKGVGLFVHRFLGVLGGKHGGVQALGLFIFILNGDLAFGVRAEPLELAVLPQLRLAFDEPVGEINRQRHQRFRLVAGKAKHDSLVAGPLVLVFRGRDAA